MEVGKLYKKRNNEITWHSSRYQSFKKDGDGLLEIDLGIYKKDEQIPNVLHSLLVIEQMKNGFKVLSGKQLFFIPKFFTAEFLRDWEEVKDGL